jgi:lipoate-protein ligase B
MLQKCVVHRLGLVAYEEAWGLQSTLAAEVAAGERPPTLLLLEHPHTFTFGRRGQLENLLWDEAELARRGVSVHWVDRGGDVTYHGPGQLVGYSIIPLDTSGLRVEGDSARLPQADYVGYVRKLELSLITALARLGVTSTQVAGLTGVWVQADQGGTDHILTSPERQDGRSLAKIAAIGVKVDARGISNHGFALNVNPDMTYWQGIIACGLLDHQVTRLADLLDPLPAMDNVIQAMISSFGEIYKYEMFEEPLQITPDSI